MLYESGHAAFDQHGTVLQQGSSQPPRGQLCQQICQQLHESLAVQQLLPPDLGRLPICLLLIACSPAKAYSVWKDAGN